jgi:DUF3099 family protein
MPRKEPEPFRITSASRGHSDDIGARQRRYVISMSIRTACFLLAVITMGHWFSWVFLAASFILPYIAVVVANGGAAPDPGGPEPLGPDPDQRALGGPAPR